MADDGSTQLLDSSDWAYASEALAILSTSCGSKKRAENMLISSLRDNRVAARSDLLIEEVDYNRLATSPPSEGGSRQVAHLGSSCALPQDFWLGKRRSRSNIELWLWNHNVVAQVKSKSRLATRRFSGKPVVYPGSRLVAYGVQFRLIDIQDVIEKTFPGHFIIMRKSRGAGPSGLDDPRWAPISDIESSARAGKLGDVVGPPHMRRWQSEMIKVIQERLGETAGWPSRQTIQRKTRQLRQLHEAALATALTHQFGIDPI